MSLRGMTHRPMPVLGASRVSRTMPASARKAPAFSCSGPTWRRPGSPACPRRRGTRRRSRRRERRPWGSARHHRGRYRPRATTATSTPRSLRRLGRVNLLVLARGGSVPLAAVRRRGAPAAAKHVRRRGFDARARANVRTTRRPARGIHPPRAPSVGDLLRVARHQQKRSAKRVERRGVSAPRSTVRIRVDARAVRERVRH